APGARPAPLALGRALPEREIERVALVLVLLHTRAGDQLVDLAARQLAVAGKIANREVHVARTAGHFLHVGCAVRDELLDQGVDLGQVIADARLLIRIDATER